MVTLNIQRRWARGVCTSATWGVSQMLQLLQFSVTAVLIALKFDTHAIRAVRATSASAIWENPRPTGTPHLAPPTGGGGGGVRTPPVYLGSYWS